MANQEIRQLDPLALPLQGTDAFIVQRGNDRATRIAADDTGFVVGPAAATPNAVAVYDGASGLLLKDGVVLGNSATRNVGTAAGTVAAGDAAPNAHKTTHENGGTDEISVAGLSGVLADPQPPIIGAGATQAVAGNDPRLTDARTPTAHAASHQNGGSDEINVGGLSGVLADNQPFAMPALNDLTDVDAPSPANSDSLVWSGTAWVAAPAQVVVGASGKFYLDASTSVADNQTLSTQPSSYPEESDSAIADADVGGGLAFFERFISGALGRSTIPAGDWTFNTWASITATSGDNFIVTRINKRVMKTALTGTFSGAGATRTFTMTSYAITAVNQGTKTFTIAGDHQLGVGSLLVVTGSTGNDGTYTVAASSDGGTTNLVVVEAIPSAVADGVLRGAPFVAGDANASILLATLIETPTQTAWITGFTNAYTVTVTLTDAGFVNVTDAVLTAMYYLLFSDTSDDLATTDLTLYSYTSAQPEFTGLNDTDRLVAAYFALTTSGVARTFSIYHGGSEHYSNIVTPLTAEHNDLSGLNDGDYKHLTATEYANMVSAAAVIGNTKLVVGSGGARGVAESALTASLVSAASGVPTAVAVGTGVITAIGVNVGAAGAVVVQDGALGTPSSGTLTNCTGLPLAGGGTGVTTLLALQQAINVAAAVSITTSTDLPSACHAKTLVFNKATAGVLTILQDDDDSEHPVGSSGFWICLDAKYTFSPQNGSVLIDNRDDFLSTQVGVSSGFWYKRATNTWVVGGDMQA